MPRFTVEEASLLCDALNGTWMHDWQAEQAREYFVAEIEDAVRLNGLDIKWEVNAAELVGKLRTMTPEEATALVSKVQDFWAKDHIGTFGSLRGDIQAAFGDFVPA